MNILKALIWHYKKKINNIIINYKESETYALQYNKKD